MGMKKEMDRTNNRSVYNKSRKHYLEKKGLIRCSYCRYHKGENRKNHYGGFIEEDETLLSAKIKWPSWKLTSKNPKQWMEKNRVKIKISEPRARFYNNRGYKYVDFQFLPNKSGIKYSLK